MEGEARCFGPGIEVTFLGKPNNNVTSLFCEIGKGKFNLKS
jgi:hypothetical protein